MKIEITKNPRKPICVGDIIDNIYHGRHTVMGICTYIHSNGDIDVFILDNAGKESLFIKYKINKELDANDWEVFEGRVTLSNQ